MKTKPLTNYREEVMEKVTGEWLHEKCESCNGNGIVPEHSHFCDPNGQCDQSCPQPAQCGNCHATGLQNAVEIRSFCEDLHKENEELKDKLSLYTSNDYI